MIERRFAMWVPKVACGISKLGMPIVWVEGSDRENLGKSGAGSPDTHPSPRDDMKLGVCCVVCLTEAPTFAKASGSGT